jgi:predicted enzyme related to lactoylglutathione lyase
MHSMHGKFIWYELMTSDTAGAAKFYGEVAGWTAKDSGMPGMDYTILSIAGSEMGVAGMLALTDEVKARGVPSNWTGYVAVDNVDRVADHFVSDGGKVMHGPIDIHGVGRFAVLADPQGAVLAVMTPIIPAGGVPPEPAPDTPGTFGWRELLARNGAEAFDFYAGIFGWQKDTGVDMGPMGIYQLFRKDDQVIGGMMTKPAEVPLPCWGYYINVDAIDAAVARVTKAGGTVIQEPMEVPGPAWIIQAIDPQGAYFALVANRR